VQPAPLAAICADPRVAKKRLPPSTTGQTSISHNVANVQIFLFLILPVSCTVSLTILSIGASQAERLTPPTYPESNRLVFRTDIAIAKLCPTTSRRHGRLLRVKLRGSNHRRPLDLVRHCSCPNENLVDECLQEQAQHRSAMTAMPLLHNSRVCHGRHRLFAVY
jgi:hypothetical protein